jgi:hypothetical protein
MQILEHYEFNFVIWLKYESSKSCLSVLNHLTKLPYKRTQFPGVGKLKGDRQPDI